MEWQKEQTQEVTSNLTTSEFTQSILKDEISNLKKDISRLTSDLRKKEERWSKEKKELVLFKDTERRKAEVDIQEQYEKDYRKFTSEHQETLSQALKSAREQHSHEKVGEVRNEKKVGELRNTFTGSFKSAHKQHIHEKAGECLKLFLKVRAHVLQRGITSSR